MSATIARTLAAARPVMRSARVAARGSVTTTPRPAAAARHPTSCAASFAHDSAAAARLVAPLPRNSPATTGEIVVALTAEQRRRQDHSAGRGASDAPIPQTDARHITQRMTTAARSGDTTTAVQCFLALAKNRMLTDGVSAHKAVGALALLVQVGSRTRRAACAALERCAGTVVLLPARTAAAALNVLLTVLCGANCHGAAEHVWTHVLHSLSIRSLPPQQQIPGAAALPAVVNSSRGVPDERSSQLRAATNTWLAFLARWQAHKALELHERLFEPRGTLVANGHTVATVLAAAAQARDYKLARELFDRYTQPPAPAAGRGDAGGALVADGDTSESKPRDAPSRVEVSLVIYNALLNAAAQCGLYEEAFRVLRRMQRSGIAPDVVSFNSVIKACCNAQMARMAFAALDEMRAAGIKPRVRDFAGVVAACAAADHLSLADDAIALMVDAGLEVPSQQLVDLAMVAAKSGDLTGALSRVKELHTRRKLSWPAVNAVMQACVRSCGLPASQGFANAARHGQRDVAAAAAVAVDVVDQVLALCTDGDDGSPAFGARDMGYLFSHAVMVHAAAGDANRVTALRNDMARHSWPPVAVAFLGYMVLAADVGDAKDVLHQMRERGLQPTAAVWRACIDVFAAAGDIAGAVEIVTDRAREQGIDGSDTKGTTGSMVAAFEAVIEAAVRRDEVDVAHAAVEAMVGAGVDATPRVMEVLVRASDLAVHEVEH